MSEMCAVRTHRRRRSAKAPAEATLKGFNCLFWSSSVPENLHHPYHVDECTLVIETQIGQVIGKFREVVTGACF